MNESQYAYSEISKILAFLTDSNQPITELDLTGLPITSFSPQLKSLIETHSQIARLVLAECHLSSLDNFPTLPCLMDLDLSSNCLTDLNLKALPDCKRLVRLNLADNQIEHVKSLHQLRKVPFLTWIDLIDNPIDRMADYRTTVFEKLRELTVLDGYNKAGELQYYEFYEDDILCPPKIKREPKQMSEDSDSEEQEIVDIDSFPLPQKKVLK